MSQSPIKEIQEGEPSKDMSNEGLVIPDTPRPINPYETYLEDQIRLQINKLFEDQQLYNKYIMQKGKNHIDTLIQANVLKFGRKRLAEVKESLKNLQEAAKPASSIVE